MSPTKGQRKLQRVATNFDITGISTYLIGFAGSREREGFSATEIAVSPVTPLAPQPTKVTERKA